MPENNINRRSWLQNMLYGTGALVGLNAASPIVRAAPISPKDKIKVTKLETFVLKNSWVFVKISTDAGITGWGEMLKDDAKACAAGALEVGDYLIGKDPRPVLHHWQAIHRGAFYRGGPIKSAISSGIDQALWDIAGKCYDVPVYKLLGGPTREKAFVYGTPDKKTGVRAMKVGPSTEMRKAHKYLEGNKVVEEVAERFGALRKRYPGVDIGIDFHGAVQPTTAALLIKALEPHNPWFFEEIIQALGRPIVGKHPGQPDPRSGQHILLLPCDRRRPQTVRQGCLAAPLRAAWSIHALRQRADLQRPQAHRSGARRPGKGFRSR